MGSSSKKLNRCWIIAIALLLGTGCTKITRIPNQDVLTHEYKGKYKVTTEDNHIHFIKSVTVLDSSMVLDKPVKSSSSLARYPLEIDLSRIKSVESHRTIGLTSPVVVGSVLLGAYAILLITTAGGMQPD